MICRMAEWVDGWMIGYWNKSKCFIHTKMNICMLIECLDYIK